MSEDLLEPGTPVNLENCHREPIRTPGGIQSHGTLLAVDEQTLEVVQVSANAFEGDMVFVEEFEALVPRPLRGDGRDDRGDEDEPERDQEDGRRAGTRRSGLRQWQKHCIFVGGAMMQGKR